MAKSPEAQLPTEPTAIEAATALQRAAVDILPFSVICLRDSLRAETLTLEVLLVALENAWIGFDLEKDREFTHFEFREDIFRLIWKRACEELAAGKTTPNLYYTETSMPFYRLELEERAALHLRTKAKFSYAQIGRVFECDPEKAEGWVNAARTRLLKRDIQEAFDREDGGGHENA